MTGRFDVAAGGVFVAGFLLVLAGCGREPSSGRPPNEPPGSSAVSDAAQSESAWFLWPRTGHYESVVKRVAAPGGFRRLAVAQGSFAWWLRALPVKPGRPDVLLYDGRKKGNQSAHVAVLDIDVGCADLQQCADAVIRLRAEYLFSRGEHAAIAFHFTSGDLARWTEWRDGLRPRVQADRVTWSRTAARDATYASFRKYLDCVFTYAGTASLSRELRAVADPALVEAGDVFIQGGHPGHAVIVLDVAADARGRRIFLLAQSYMPAQDMHVLVAPGSPISPWYYAARSGELVTPEWTFRYAGLRRFD